ncbi:hypothetical protein LINGRAHAP2_LOCUS33791 [Linum grandiflorum]
MESERNGTRSSIGSKRKPPLSDCTNTVHNRSSTNYSSSSSSSSVLKKPFPVSFKFLDSQRIHASTSNSPIDRDQSAAGSTTDAVKKSRVSIPSSAVQEGSSIATPARLLHKPAAVVGGDDGSFPVFVGRQPESGRKVKETPIGVPSTKSHFSNSVLMPPSAVRRSSTSTSARPLAKPSLDAGANDVFEPSPVYDRRQSGSKEKDKENRIDITSTKSHSSNNALIPLSAVWKSLIPTLARPLAKPSSDAGAKDVLETSPVNVRRQSGRKRKDKENPIDMPSTRSHSSNNVPIPLSAVRRSSRLTPARPLPSPSSDIEPLLEADDVLEPSPVFVRRRSGSKRKDKEKPIDTPPTKIRSSSRLGWSKVSGFLFHRVKVKRFWSRCED